MKQSNIGAYGSYIESILPKTPAKLSFLNKEFKSYPAWKKKAYAKVMETLGMPDSIKATSVKVLKKYEWDGLYFEELEYKLPYGPKTKAIFLKPANAKGKLPGILGLHDHSGQKFWGYKKIVKTKGSTNKILQELQDSTYEGKPWANEIAKRGYAVLVHDCFTFDSRKINIKDVIKTGQGKASLKEPTSIKDINEYQQWSYNQEHLIAKSLFCAGTTWPGMALNEDMAALTLLAARKDVDSKNIGCGGLSGGGLRTTFLAGLDDRIKCSFCAGFMTTWKDLALQKACEHTWMAFLPGLPKFLDFPEIYALRAPKPAMVLSCNNDDLYTLKEMKNANSIIKKVYTKANASDKFLGKFYPGGHKMDKPMQKDAFDWMDKWLK